MQFQISSQECFQQTIFYIRYIRQHLRAIIERRYSRGFTLVENTISNSLEFARAKFHKQVQQLLGHFLQLLLAFLNFNVGASKIKDFYELWQQHKCLKTNQTNEAWPDTYDERYTSIYISSNLDSFAKFSGSNRRTQFKDVFSWNIPQMVGTKIIINCVMKM